MASDNSDGKGRLVREGLVIVISILLAFALDAWWDDAADRRDLRQDLIGVSEEIRVNQGRIDFQVDLMERTVAGGDSLLAAFSAAEEGASFPPIRATRARRTALRARRSAA